MNNTAPIGVFDSGLGGLTILAALKKVLPFEAFVYCADQAHVPYGNKSEQEILFYSEEIVRWMLETYKIKAAIIACHTSSAVCSTALQKRFSIPIFDTIAGTVRSILESAPSNVGILGTKRTIETNIYKRKLLEYGYKGKITQIACPALVPLIEHNRRNDPEVAQAISIYCADRTIDTFVYACTHYPLLQKSFMQKVPHASFINPALSIALQVSHALNSLAIRSSFITEPEFIFHTTAGDVQEVHKWAEEIFNTANER